MFGGRIGVPELLLLFLVLSPAIIVGIAGWWRIFSRTGLPPVLSLTMFIPFVSFFVFLWFAFFPWPIEKKAGATQG